MKISKALVDATLKTGLPPIDMKFFPCYNEDGAAVAYCGMTVLNTVEFGVLTPSQYRLVAGRTNQAVRLGEKSVDKAILELRRRMSTLGEYEYIMLELPRKMLDNDLLAGILEARFATGDFLVRDKLCILFGSDILLTDPAQTVPRLKTLTALGVRIGITDFGDESTSTLRLAQFPFDVAVLDRSVAGYVREGNDAALSATVAFAKALGLQVYMNGALNEDEKLRAFKCGVKAILDTEIITQTPLRAEEAQDG